MANKITKSELKQMIRETLREELLRIKQLKESADNKGFKIGDKATVTRDLMVYPGDSTYGVIKAGTVVTITAVGPRGYDITDDNGNEVDEVRLDYLARV